MKNLIPILLLAIISCSAPKTDGYLLKGKISGESPDVAILQMVDEGELVNLDTAAITNGEFEFTGIVTNPDLHYIAIGNERISIFIENSQIKVSAAMDSLQSAIITGSKIQNELNAYKESKKTFEDQLAVVYAEYKNASDIEKPAVEARYDSIDQLKSEHIKSYIKTNGSSTLAPFIVRRELIHSLDLAELEELTNTLSPELKNNKYTKQLFERIEILRTVQPGMQAPDFTQNDVDGNPVNLSDFRGKYLLIDFWASWCGPCRRANPTVVKVYKKYSKKNFTILGVSMDDKKDKWLGAIEEDKLYWAQVSTLEGWKNPVGKLYGVNSIPHAILLDPDGKVVKRGIHPEELDEILSELLK